MDCRKAILELLISGPLDGMALQSAIERVTGEKPSLSDLYDAITKLHKTGEIGQRSMRGGLSRYYLIRDTDDLRPRTRTANDAPESR